MNKKILMLYFSRAGQNWISSGVRYAAVGNCEIVAALCKRFLSDQLDIRKVDALTPYDSSYRSCSERAKYEIENHNYVPYKLLDLNIGQFQKYDTIIVCYPIYFSNMPRPLYELLKHYGLNDKTVIPIATHEGSGFGMSLNELRETFPKINLVYGKSFIGSEFYHLFCALNGTQQHANFNDLCTLVKKADEHHGVVRELRDFLKTIFEGEMSAKQVANEEEEYELPSLRARAW